MTPERLHHPSGPLVLAGLLAAVAGFVDSFVYLSVTPVFVANMSGNLIRIGMFAGERDWRPALAAGVAVSVFVCGVVLATIHHDRRLNVVASVRPNGLLAVEAGLLLSIPIALHLGDVGFDAVPTLRQYPALVISALAMGIQTAALRRVGQVAVATTYGTGALVRIGEKVALGARRAERADDHRRRITVVVLGAVIVLYVLGAVAGSAIGSSEWALLIPGTTVAAAAVTLYLRGWRFPAPIDADAEVS